MSPEQFSRPLTWSGSADPDPGYTLPAPGTWSANITGADDNLSMSADSLGYDLPGYADSIFSDIPIIGPIIDWIEGQLTVLYSWLTSQFSWVLSKLRDAIQPILTVVLTPINTAVTWVQSHVLDVWHWLSSTIPAAIEVVRVKLLDVWNWVTTTIPNALSWLKDHVASLVSKVGNIIPAITSAADYIIKTIGRVLSTILDTVDREFSAIFKGLMPELPKALQYNSPEVQKAVISWWPTGTSVKDWIKTFFKFYLYSAWIAKDIWTIAMNKNNEEVLQPAVAQLSEKIDRVQDSTQSVKDFMGENIADPILDGIKHLFEHLAEIFKAAFDAIWNALKEFFTVILPNWFRALWDALHTAVAWVWDKVKDVAGFFLDEILKLVGIHSPITPEGGLGTLKCMINVGLAMAGELGLMTLAGNLVHPIHSLGLEHVSAMIYDMTNYKLVIGAGMGVIAACSIRIPLTQYFNSILRPNIPSERDVREMYDRELISFKVYSEYLALRGYADKWHENLAAITETPLRYFGLAAIARSGYYDPDFFNKDLIRGGYAADSRKLLLNMFAQTSSESIKGLMSGIPVKRFKEGLTSESQFQSELTILGYTDQQFPQYLAAARMEYAYDYITDLIAAYRDAVRKGNISIDQYRESLLGLGIVGEKVEAYVLRERARLKPAEKLTPISPVKATYETDAGKVQVDTLRRQRRKGTIARDQEIAGLQQLGMPVDYARAVADNDDIRLAEKVTPE
jgi:hypothetical protein